MLSVFTPSHDTRYLAEAYAGLARQTTSDWEWLVVLNGKPRHWAPPVDDERVTVVVAPADVRGVGALKRYACERVTGDVLVELDHDDVLLPRCLEEIADVFSARPEVVCVYSDFAQIGTDGTPDTTEFDLTSGWTYTDETVEGVTYHRCHAMAPSPHNLGYIWYEPNHVRAFRRTAYESVGGYDAGKTILDDQDLLMRLFVAGDFHHLDQLLYLQRVHRHNTQSRPTINAAIQQQTVELYQERIRHLVLAWTARQGLRAIRLIPPGWFGPPTEEGFEDVEFDLGDDLELPVESHSVGAVLAVDVLQKVFRRDLLLNEAHRVLVHGGLLLTTTPSTDGRGAFQDPSAVAYYNENSFIYLTQSALRPTIPALTARLQVSHLRTYFPTAVHEQMHIPYVEANLIAIKDGARQGGPLLC